jgi:hypothetical protein
MYATAWAKAAVDLYIASATVPAKAEERDPLERVLNLKAGYKRQNRYLTPTERREYRQTIRDAVEEADTGVKVPRWALPALGWEARLQAVLDKYPNLPRMPELRARLCRV